MQLTTIVLTLVGMSITGYVLGARRAYRSAGGPSNLRSLHSLPGYHGFFVALCCLLPAAFVLLGWIAAEPRVIVALVTKTLPDAARSLSEGELNLLINNVRNLAAGDVVAGDVDSVLAGAASQFTEFSRVSRLLMTVLVLGIALLGAALAWRRIAVTFRARQKVETVVTGLLISASSIAILTTVGIVASVLFEAVRFFGEVPLTEFLFGLNWSPQTAIRADQVGSSGSFGAVPLFAGTLLITAIAMVVAAPVGLMTAIYMAEYAAPRVRDVAKPLLEILAGIPTVVYGFFAALTVAPALRSTGESLGIAVASESALAAGLVMGIMIIPLVSSLSDDAIKAVPRAMRDGALGLGSTRSEAMINVILPAALPGIVGGVLLAVSRAIGETMIVVMAAGLAANLTANPLEAVTTVTVQIVTLLVGDQEFDSAKTLAAFALGLVLFVVTLCLNVIGLQVVRKYREQYE
jgi:phosphate transport system permease protein